MSRRKKIACGVLLALVLCIGGLTAWQWNNISAALSFIRYSQDEIDEKLKENDQAIKDAVAAHPDISIRDLTEEEKQALKDGTLTEEELVSGLLGKGDDTQEEREEPSGTQQPAQSAPQEPSQSTVQPPAQSTTQQPSQSTTAKPSQSTAQRPDQSQSGKSDYEDKLAELIARIYVLREQYLIELDKVKDAALADYKALTAEQRTGSGLTDLVGKYLSIGTELEKECDKKMDDLIAELETLLKANNGDMSIADTVFQTYVNEKSLKKAWYMSELKERGLI